MTHDVEVVPRDELRECPRRKEDPPGVAGVLGSPIEPVEPGETVRSGVIGPPPGLPLSEGDC